MKKNQLKAIVKESVKNVDVEQLKKSFPYFTDFRNFADVYDLFIIPLRGDVVRELRKENLYITKSALNLFTLEDLPECCYPVELSIEYMIHEALAHVLYNESYFFDAENFAPTAVGDIDPDDEELNAYIESEEYQKKMQACQMYNSFKK